jgi:hypothetical protein
VVFQSLVNSSVTLAPGKRNIAIVIQAPSATANFSPVQALYSKIRSEGTHFITDCLTGIGHNLFLFRNYSPEHIWSIWSELSCFPP